MYRDTLKNEVEREGEIESNHKLVKVKCLVHIKRREKEMLWVCYVRNMYKLRIEENMEI